MRKTIGDYLPDVLRGIERTFFGTTEPKGIPTGFTDLDYMTGGIQSGLTVIGAAPGMGLSSLGRQLGMNMARAGHRGAVFDFELTPEMVARRLLGTEAGIADMKIRAGLLKRDDLGRLAVAAGAIGEIPLVLEKRKLYSIGELANRIRGLARLDACEWALIDRFDHILPDTDDESPEKDLAERARALRALGEELKIAIIALCRIEGDTANRFPGVAFRREAEPLLRDADTVLFLRRTRAKANSGFFQVELSILKQREGPVGDVRFGFSPAMGLFREGGSEEHDGYDENDNTGNR